jgi:hypothetical protein
VSAFADQSDANLSRFGAELERAQHARHQLDEAIGEQRRAIEAAWAERLRLTAQLEIAEAASGRFARETSAIGHALSIELKEQLEALRLQIAKAAEEEHLALDARQKEYVEATRTQLDDVLRAYQLANARQQEADCALRDRVTSMEKTVRDQAQGSATAIDRVGTARPRPRRNR